MYGDRIHRYLLFFNKTDSEFLHDRNKTLSYGTVQVEPYCLVDMFDTTPFQEKRHDPTIASKNITKT